MVQFAFLTPKDHPSDQPPKNQPYVGAIFGTNILCILLHTISNSPEAGEIMRGYLHGGLLIDFIGVKGPTSKIRLVCFDLLTLVLQVVMLAVTIESQGLKVLSTSGESTTNTGTQSGIPQDHDAEERGVHRVPTQPTITSFDGPFDDIELQPLRQSTTGRSGGEEDAERDELLAEPSDRRTSPNTHPLDSFYTGTSVVADLHLIDTVQTQYLQYQRAPPATTSSLAELGNQPSIRYIRFPGGRLAVSMRARTDQG
jgi:hypothetical protein